MILILLTRFSISTVEGPNDVNPLTLTVISIKFFLVISMLLQPLRLVTRIKHALINASLAAVLNIQGPL